MNWPAILGAVGAIGGLGGMAAFAQVLISRPKLRADAADQISDTAVGLLAPLRQRIGELEVEVEQLRSTVRRLNLDLDERDRTIRRLSGSNGSTYS